MGNEHLKRREAHLISSHFLKRRAEARRRQIRRWMTEARTRPGDSVGAEAARRLLEFDLTAGDTVIVRKRGKWDARYDVLAVDAR